MADHLTKLAEGNFVSPVCSPDGSYVYYVNFDQPQNVWRVSSHGGAPVKIVRTLGGSIIGRLSMSPNGQLLAYPHTVSTNEPDLGWRVAITPADGGPTHRVFDVPSNIEGPRWSPDGRLVALPGNAKWNQQHLGAACGGWYPTPIDTFRVGVHFRFFMVARRLPPVADSRRCQQRCGTAKRSSLAPSI